MSAKPIPRESLSNMPLLRFCLRCGRPFSPDWMRECKFWTRNCRRCRVKNLREGLLTEG
jgi:hypothetical protein